MACARSPERRRGTGQDGPPGDGCDQGLYGACRTRHYGQDVRRAHRPNPVELDDEVVERLDGEHAADGLDDFSHEDLERQLEGGYRAPEEALHLEDPLGASLLDEGGDLDGLEGDVHLDDVEWAVASCEPDEPEYPG